MCPIFWDTGPSPVLDIRENYSFVPSKHFIPVEMKEEWMMPFAQLKEVIVERIQREKKKIKESAKVYIQE